MTAATPRPSDVTSTDGTEIAVTVTGQGRPLVVSPGALNAAQDWQLLADLLAPHFTTYAIDRRGRGASGDHSQHTIQREADDIAAVLDLAGPDAILLGHSYGGLVSLAHALHQPPAAFILYEPPIPLDGPVGGDAIARFEEAVQAGDLDQALTLGLRNFLKFPDEAIEEFRQTPFWAIRASMTPTWAREMRAMDGFGDDLTRFAALDIPTLLVIGELSPRWLTDVSRRLHRALPDARLVEIPGEAHDAFLTGPHALADAIAAFAADLTD
ncbi:alpha/beta hydrolase [Streptomyces sp. NPDC005480]|uniref:alpha/beta fold hydrolase n=1 Tax=Streptomyces sp. NPDC005480 TaxID=3154880 RepID=UPI0033B798AD